MLRSSFPALSLSTLLLIALLAFLPYSAVSRKITTRSPKILLFTKTAGYRHAAIPTAVKVITALGSGSITPDALDSSVADATWSTVHTEDETKFETYSYLKKFDAIVFAFTTDVDPPGVGTILTDKGVANFMKYIQAGGNFVGIHSATNTLYAYPAYGRLAGAFFTYHAGAQKVSLKSTSKGKSHPATSQLPDPFKIKEEMYHLRSNPRDLPSAAHVILTNATAYPDPGGTHREGKPQPLSWWREGGLLNSGSSKLGGGLDGETNYTGGSGRSFITTLGHEKATWSNDYFRGHIMGAIAWTLASKTSCVVNSTAAIGTNCTDTTDDDGDETATNSGDGGTASGVTSASASSSGRALWRADELLPMGSLVLFSLAMGGYCLL